MDMIKLTRDPGSHEHEPRTRTTNNRYVVTFSLAEMDIIREFVNGEKAVTLTEVKAILRQRIKHYG
jgi:hypothetical protein